MNLTPNGDPTGERYLYDLPWSYEDWPEWWNNFYNHCADQAEANDWHLMTTINLELRPWGCRLITPRTSNWYLRWNRPDDITLFVLKWS